jgi:alpha,alpha-trehalose phosphorylase
LSFTPRLPGGIAGLTFRLRYRGRKLLVSVTGRQVRYELLEGDPLPLIHYGEQVLLEEKPVERDTPPVEAGPRPRQPRGREPVSRRKVGS